MKDKLLDLLEFFGFVPIEERDRWKQYYLEERQRSNELHAEKWELERLYRETREAAEYPLAEKWK